MAFIMTKAQRIRKAVDCRASLARYKDLLLPDVQEALGLSHMEALEEQGDALAVAQAHLAALVRDHNREVELALAKEDRARRDRA